MIPVRLTLLLIGVLALLLVALGNPQRVQLNFIFWTGVYELYKVLIGAVAMGVILGLLYQSQVRSLMGKRGSSERSARSRSRR